MSDAKILDFTKFHKPLAARGVLAIESFLLPGMKTELAFWEHDRIYFVRRGELELELTDEVIKLSKNEILFLPASTRHSWKTQNDGHVALLTICFEPDFFDGTPPIQKLLKDFTKSFPANQAISPEKSLDAVAVRHILSSVVREKRAQREEGVVMLIGLFIELIAILLSAQNRHAEFSSSDAKDGAFTRSVAYLNERLCEEISVSDLAGVAQLSTRRYLDVFKNNYGMTPRRYIIKKRIGIAKELMLETGNILHSSLDAGFSNLSHFYRTFKQHTGMTPNQFIISQSDPVLRNNGG